MELHNMNGYAPKVSIGIPVYNGEKYLEETLKSLLSQTFQDFEIIISDNASTDSTPDLCRDYCQQDPRIHYYRAEVNQGPGWNYNRVFDLAIGEYFKWQAHDDLLAPDFLAQCVAVLDHKPEVLLCYCDTAHVDDHGIQIAVNAERLPTDQPQPSQRFRALVESKQVSCEIFGLMRKSVLDRLPRMGAYAHGDVLFICRLLLEGPFHQIPEPLFQFRLHAAQSMQTLPAHLTQRQRRRIFKFSGPLPATDWWDPSKKDKIDFPTWRFYWLQSNFIQQQPMSLPEKWKCYQALLDRLFPGKDLLRLGVDGLLALETVLQNLSKRPVNSPSAKKAAMPIPES
jgi:glycosyltransferase involved in cell wall biosynthesis